MGGLSSREEYSNFCCWEEGVSGGGGEGDDDAGPGPRGFAASVLLGASGRRVRSMDCVGGVIDIIN
jgi:hypothetical protein